MTVKKTLSKNPVPSKLYDETYFLNSCGGSELFRAYGSQIIKANMADVLIRAPIYQGQKILDVGCGRGELLVHLKKLGAEPTGCDFSEAALKIARTVSPDTPLFQCDAKKLPFPDQQFDIIFLRGVFEHLHPWEQDQCFQEMQRTLKPNGNIIMDTCTNKLYFKVVSYGLRKRLTLFLNKLGFSFKLPSAPRSDEDEQLHVSEQSYFSLRQFFKKHKIKANIFPRPNPKFRLIELYGKAALLPNFPIKPVNALRQVLHRVFFRAPLAYFFARSFTCVVEPIVPRLESLTS